MIEYFKTSIYANLIYEDRYQFLLTGLWVTLLLTFVSFILGTLLGALFCAGKGNRHKWVRGITNLFTGLMIKLPPLVLLMIFVYLIFVNTSLAPVVVAIITFTLKTGSQLSVMFRSAVDSVQAGEVEAARTLGMSKRQAFIHVVFPQAMHQVLPLYKTQFILTMQDTSVVSLVAIQDLTRATTIITSRTMDPFISLIITSVVYLVLGYIANAMLNIANREKHIDSAEEK